MNDADEIRSTARGINLIPQLCRARRLALGLSQEQLAERARGELSLSLSTIKRIERGLAVDAGSARTLAKLLETDLVALQGSPTGNGRSAPSERRSAIAVLPFQLCSYKPEAHAHLAETLADDLVIRLGRSWFPVIGRCVSAAETAAEHDLQALGARLDARYLVVGSVWISESRVRMGVQLVDSETRVLVWGDHFERATSDAIQLQDELSDAISSRITRAVLASATQRCRDATDPEALTAWERGLRGAWHYYRCTPTDNELARQHLEVSVSLGATRAAHFWLCMSYQQQLAGHWSLAPQRTLEAFNARVASFREQFPYDACGYTAAAYTCIYAGNRETARDLLIAAVEEGPNLGVARSLYGQLLAMSNQPEEALEHLTLALNLSPLDPTRCAVKTSIGLAHFVREDYDAMVQWSEAATHDAEHSTLSHAALACGLAAKGELERAGRALARALASPAFEDSMRLLMASTEPAIARRFVTSLRKAGLPLSYKL